MKLSSVCLDLFLCHKAADNLLKVKSLSEEL